MAKTGASLNNLWRDGSTHPVQIGSSFQTNDATGTPQVSPLAYTGSVTTLVMPDNAAEIILAPSTDMRISEVANMAQYYIIPAGQAEAIGISKQTNIYIAQNASNGTLNFRITLI